MWQIIPKGTVDRMVRLLLVGLSVCFLSACEQKTEIIIPQPGERTVLIYFAADNDLAPFALEDIDELKEGVIAYGLPSDEHLLMYVDIGGTASLSELTYQNGKAVEKVIKTYPTRNSAGLAETQEVFQDVFNNPAYEAASYGLVYWSHCDGWIPYPVPTTRWIGIDTGGYADNCMNLSEFKEVLQTSAPHFDFILFDACFMQSIEVAYELRNFTDYYICSPTETPGPGAPYDAILPYMFQPGASPELAEAYFDVYNGMYNQGGSEWSYGVSMCALKTSELESLAAATRQGLQSLAVSADCATLRAQSFDYDQRSLIYHIGYYDFAQLMEAVLDSSAFATWKSAFDAAVAYWDTTAYNYSTSVGRFSMEGAQGVSIYIPSTPRVQALDAYRSLDWYEAAGIASLGW